MARAEGACGDRPPHRVEMYATYTGGAGIKLGLWVTGFGPDQQPAATLHVDQGMESEADELLASVAEFLGEDEPTAASTAAQGRGRWYWLTEQPLGVTITGGAVATLLAAGIAALVSLLF